MAPTEETASDQVNQAGFKEKEELSFWMVYGQPELGLQYNLGLSYQYLPLRPEYSTLNPMLQGGNTSGMAATMPPSPL